jgi:hypothetical protein
MAKEFKLLKGNRIYVSIPKKDEKSKIIVDENTKEELSRKLLEKMRKLTVYAVGDSISDISEGDEILVDPGKLKDGLVIPLTDEKSVLLVSYFDVIHVW